MHVKLILPSLQEAGSPDWRPIKYSLFPPLGLATLAAYLDPSDQIELTLMTCWPVGTSDKRYIVKAYLVP